MFLLSGFSLSFLSIIRIYLKRVKMLKGLRNKNDLTRGVFNNQFQTEMLSGKEQYLKTEIHTLLKP